jgi:uncharacterized repeat protein (TIGR04052 family)
LATLTLAAACKPDEEPPPPEDTGPFFQDVTLRFSPTVGGLSFGCSSQYQAIGATGSPSVRFQDFRMYVHTVGLIDAVGSTALLELDGDSPWQTDNLALLDFESGASYCEGGTPEENREITGRVPVGDYRGVAFTVGLPEGFNHQLIDGGTPAPLAVEAMNGGVFDGYTFFKLDLASSGRPDGWPIRVHEGGCQTDDDGDVTACTSPNQVTYVLPQFDVSAQTVLLDLEDLLVRNDLDRDRAQPGCGSDATDPDCQDFFVSYGLSALPPTWIRAE